MTAPSSYKHGGRQPRLAAPLCIGRDSGHFWFPSLHALNNGNRLCIVPRVSDEAHGNWRSRLFLWTSENPQWRDQGEIMLGWASLEQAANELLLLPFNLRRNGSKVAQGIASRISAEHGGQVRVDPIVLNYSGFPCDFRCREDGHLSLVASGDSVLRLPDGRWFTTLYGLPEGEERYSNMAVVSDDARHWRFLSWIATAKQIDEAQEGPSESATVSLNDGRLLCVYRVDSGPGKDYYCSISQDQGCSWGAPERMPGMGSVKPQIRKLPNGRFLLAGGRPGLFLWYSDDAFDWRVIDLLQRHNAHVSVEDSFAPPQTPTELPVKDLETAAPSTCYISLCLDVNGEALLAYDRLANGWEGAPGPAGDRDAVFFLTVSDF